MTSKLIWVVGSALTLLSGCIFQESPIEMPSTTQDQGMTQDMTSPPDLALDDMSARSDQGAPAPDMSVSCELTTCELGATSCADARTLQQCELVDGCLKPSLTACEAGQRCVEGDDQPAQCLPNPCTRDGETFCAPDQSSAIVCVAAELEGVFRQESILCRPDEACSMVLSQCVPHECTEDERSKPYLCKTPSSYTQCQQVEGLRILSAPISCDAQQVCVPGMSDPTKACKCEHDCKLDEAACDAADPNSYKVCVEDPSTGCRTWQLKSCPAPNPSANDGWLNLGCFKGDQGFARLKCWSDSGRCSLDREPGCRD